MDVRPLKTCVLDRLYGEKHVNHSVFKGNMVKTLWETMFWKGFLHLCLGWPRKSEKTPQITVFSKVWGYNKGIGNYFKLPRLGSPHRGETLKFLSVGGPHAGKKCQKQHGGKIWNSLPWEDPTGGKNKDIPIPYMHICLVGILAHETIHIYIYVCIYIYIYYIYTYIY